MLRRRAEGRIAWCWSRTRCHKLPSRRNRSSANEIRHEGVLMPVKKEANGRRSIQVEVEVPGTPEEVWQAIATGPGITSWFVPTEVESGKDGKPERMVLHFAPGMDSDAKITAYDAPHRLAAEDTWGPGSPV